MNRTLATRTLLPVLVLAAGLCAPNPGWAGDFRLIQTGGLNLSWADPSQPPSPTSWNVDSTVMVKLAPLTLLGLFRNDTWLPDTSQTCAGLGASLSLDRNWYATLSYRGLWNSGTALYSHRLDAELAREEGPLALVLHERLEANSLAASSLTSLSATWTPLPWLGLHLSPLLGWDGGANLTPGIWGYAEFRLQPLVLRAGASAGSYHDPSATPADGLDAALLARLGLQLTETILVALDGQLNLGDRGGDSASLNLVLDLGL